MSIIYLCRHCDTKIGEINESVATISLLDLNKLTLVDKKKMIHYEPNGDALIKVICENCKQTLDDYPNYYELDFFIH